MKTKAVETPFAIHYIDEEKSLLEQTWTNERRRMNDNDYKENMHHYLRLVEKYEPRLALINTKQFAYIIAPEIQKWVDENIAVSANKIVQKIAFVLPSDIFDIVSIEQTMQEQEGLSYHEVRYFEDNESAELWLLF